MAADGARIIYLDYLEFSIFWSIAETSRSLSSKNVIINEKNTCSRIISQISVVDTLKMVYFKKNVTTY